MEVKGSIIAALIRVISVVAEVNVTWVDEMTNGNIDRTGTKGVIAVIICWIIAWAIDSVHLMKIDRHNTEEARKRRADSGR